MNVFEDAAARDRDDWNADYYFEPGIAANSFSRGWEAAFAVVTDEMVEIFKAAWDDADRRGLPDRSRIGISAVFGSLRELSSEREPCLGYTLSNPCRLLAGHLGAHDPRPDRVSR